MGALMRSIDWARTPLGPIERWPQSLRTSISICLSSRFPILVWWGLELVMLYNDAYRPMLGATKHPRAMGRPGREVWPEVWPIIGPMLEGVLARGEATWSDDQLLLLDRNGFLEECYFTFSYSPIRDESGGVGGVFCAVTETTGRVLGERRLQTLRALAEQAIQGKTA
ncbi:MAG TPA: PAS domain-containing protein, partial [Thermoanaerobaculia bacterium]|nr:PAS domain-containing protein [Thermoanaerobaculia bacterium]